VSASFVGENMQDAVSTNTAIWVIGVAKGVGVLPGETRGDRIGDANRLVVERVRRYDRSVHPLLSEDCAKVAVFCAFPLRPRSPPVGRVCPLHQRGAQRTAPRPPPPRRFYDARAETVSDQVNRQASIFRPALRKRPIDPPANDLGSLFHQVK